MRKLNLVITAGGTSEPIDKVRKITNMSRGTLGKELFKSAYSRDSIGKIFYLAPRSAFPVEPGKYHFFKKVSFVETNSTADLEHNLKEVLTGNEIDAVCHSMAVSDYTVDSLFDVESLAEHLSKELAKGLDISVQNLVQLIQSGSYRIDNSSKVSSKIENLCIQLKRTEKVISKIKEWSPDVVLVGFKLLENVSKDDLIQASIEQQARSGSDMVFANDIREIRERGHCGYLVQDKDNYVFLDGIYRVRRALLDAVEEKVEEKSHE